MSTDVTHHVRSPAGPAELAVVSEVTGFSDILRLQQSSDCGVTQTISGKYDNTSHGLLWRDVKPTQTHGQLVDSPQENGNLGYGTLGH